MQKLDKNAELQALLASKKFCDWTPSTVQQKKSGALEYTGENFEVFSSYSYQNNGSNPKQPFEKHYSPAEVAEVWGISVDLARSLFKGEPDVLALDRTKRGKYITLRIPESVMVRVHRRLSQG